MNKYANANGSSDTSALWEPISIGPVRVKNRIAMAAMTMGWAQLNNVMSDEHLDYFEERARGGVGVIITEQQTADRNRVQHLARSLSALRPEAVIRYRELADRVRPHDTKVFVQLLAPGTQEGSGMDLNSWAPTFAPSPIPSRSYRENPAVMTAADLAEMAENFALAAQNVRDGGLHGVEIHGSHSWLVHRFLSPAFNLRDDEYGGSAEKRCRFALDIARAIRSKVGSDLAIGLQVSVEDYFGDGGLTVPLVLEQLRHIVESGLYDYINLSTGNEFSDGKTVPPVEVGSVPTEDAGRQVMTLVSSLKDSNVGVKVMVQGGVRDVATAARLVDSGKADFVGLARPLLADPHLVRKTREGRANEVMPCVGVGECFWRSLDGLPTVCAHNPVTGRERRWGLDAAALRSARARRVAIVGAGPAGLEAAATAASRGHEVTVFERSPYVGGRLRLEGLLPHRERWFETINAFAARATTAGSRLLLSHDITADSPELADFDVVLLATGATWSTDLFQSALPLVPRMPRGATDRVVGLDSAIQQAVDDPRALGDSVVIVDESDDYPPLGLADLLSAAGVKVVVVTGANSVGQHVTGVADDAVFGRLSTRDVTLSPQTVVNGFHGGVVSLTEHWSGRRRDVSQVDTVVAATYRTVDEELYDALLAQRSNVRRISDAAVPRRMPEALADAHDVAFGL